MLTSLPHTFIPTKMCVADSSLASLSLQWGGGMDFIPLHPSEYGAEKRSPQGSEQQRRKAEGGRGEEQAPLASLELHTDH